MLGVCQASDPYYAHLLVDKMLYMVPEDQARLKEIMRYRSVLDEFLLLVDEHSGAPWFQANARLFLEFCDLFAVTARQHHNELVARFIEKPSETLDDRHLTGITASGPPLQSLINSLQTLRDLRTAADRSDIATRHANLARLRAVLA